MATAGGSFQTTVENIGGSGLIIDYSETIGNYTTPSSAVITSIATSVIDFSSTTGWTKTGTAQDIAAGVLSFQAKQGAGIQAEVYDFGLQSDTFWEYRFKMTCSTLVRAALPSCVLNIGLSSIASGNNLAAQDFIGLFFDISNTRDAIIGTVDSDGASLGVADNVSSYAFAASDVRYIKLARTSATAYSVKIYSDSSYTTLVETVNGTCASTTQNLRYFTISVYSGGSANNSTFTGTIDDLSYGSFVNNAIDSNDATHATTTSEINPAIYFDMGSALNLCAVAIKIGASNTCTQFKIRLSSDTSFADGENVRTINASLLSAGSYGYVLFNVASMRYLQIIGTDAGAKVLSITDVKIRTVTDAVLNLTHGHLLIDGNDSALGLDGI